jgi:hypothetical protein
MRLPIAEPIAESCAYGYGASAPEPTERVQNGDFASATGWNTSGVAWTIAAGVATNNTAGQFLTNTLVTPLVGGESYSFSVNIIANPAATGVQVQLYNSSTTATQAIFSDGTTTGIKNSAGTVSGAFDQIRIGAIDDAGLVIDDMSLLA